MPIVLKRDEKDFSIRIWQSIESFEELLEANALNDDEKVRWHAFQSDKRKREWLTVRVLLKSLYREGSMPSISYDEFGKPFLSNHQGISVSHTGNFIAIIISEKAGAGIDLETLRERIIVLSTKFINDTEKSSLPEHGIVEHLHVLWGAKEVLFKLNGRGELDFRNHLFVQPFNYTSNGKVQARIQREGKSKTYDVFYELWNEMMLAYAISD